MGIHDRRDNLRSPISVYDDADHGRPSGYFRVLHDLQNSTASRHSSARPRARTTFTFLRECYGRSVILEVPGESANGVLTAFTAISG